MCGCEDNIHENGPVQSLLPFPLFPLSSPIPSTEKRERPGNTYHVNSGGEVDMGGGAHSNNILDLIIQTLTIARTPDVHEIDSTQLHR